MKKVLIIDDDLEFLDEMEELLTSSGYKVTPLLAGGGAVEVARRLMPDIVLLDLKLGMESGFLIAHGLRSTEETKNIPIIAITGYYKEEEHAHLAKNCEINKFLIKPVNPTELIATIRGMGV